MHLSLRHAHTFALAVALASAACVAGSSPGVDGQSSASTTPLDRLIIGRASKYVADPAMGTYAPLLAASQVERRKMAWSVIRKVTEPVGLDDEGRALPRFQTWFGRDEIVPMFEHILLGQTDAERRAHKPPTPEVLEETFEWIANRATTLGSFTAERLAKRRAELDEVGDSSLGGQERVLMSPALVGHLLTHYDALFRCLGGAPEGAAPPPSATNFAPCVGEEFPPDAVVVKARWVPNFAPLAVIDTSAASLTSALKGGEWLDGTATADPGPEAIYTMRLSSGLTSRLVALHVVTRSRDWTWISMFWSNAPNADFGADRPAELTGFWGSYKMCAVVDYDEGDTGGGDAALDPSLAAAFAATRAFGPRSWCSNPYLEKGPHNARTNCIGCHQHAGTDATTDSILDSPEAFPDDSRRRVRQNFPADYTFVTSTGLELSSRMFARFDSLVPPL